MARPPEMPSMDGANMPMAEDMPIDAGRPNPEDVMLPKEAVAQLMRPSEEIGAVLMARLSNMSQEELAMLDSAITPEIANVLKRLLPELTAIIEQIEGGEMMPEEQMMMAEQEVGALGAMG
jgi:hypothetical protein